MSVFDTAKKLPVSVKETKKASDKEVIPVTGLANYAMVDAVVKGYTALLDTFGGMVKNEMASIFVGMGKQLKKRPDNFRGTEGDRAEASCELRVRNWNSVLTPEETAILDRYDVPYKKRETKAEGYFVNPAHYAFLEKMKGLPEDFLLYQAQETVPVVSAETVDAVFAKGLADKLLDIVGTLAIKSQYKGTLAEALKEAEKFVVAAESAQKTAEEIEAAAKAEESAKRKAKAAAKKGA